jgi:hypothetical protein
MTNTDYELKDGIKRVVRPSFVLEAGETIALDDETAAEYDDVLTPVGETDSDSEESTDE